MTNEFKPEMNSLEQSFHDLVVANGIQRESFYCPVCKRDLPVMAGVITHDNVPHPEDLVLGESE